MKTERRKQLVEQYKQMKPDMGIFQIRSKVSGKVFLETSHNLKGMLNRVQFQLEAGSHPNQELQQEWKELGSDQFEIEVLETLKYDKDESKIDYSEELTIMRMVWEERLAKDKVAYYQQRLPI